MNKWWVGLVVATEGSGEEIAIESSSFMGSCWLRVSALAAILVCALMTGCAVGPDFRTPAAPKVNRYTARPLPAKLASTPVAGGEAQRFVNGGDIPADWWTLFHSPALNALIERSLAHNPDLKVAQANGR